MSDNVNKPTPAKRLRMTYTVDVKIETIQKVMSGETKASVARAFRVPESTLRGWCKKDELKKLAEQINNHFNKKDISEASTSSGVVNSNHVAEPITSSQLRINNIVQHLPEQPESRLTSRLVSLQPIKRNILGERVMPDNSLMNDNRSNRVHEIVHHGTKLVTWLKKNGTPIATFTQVTILENMVESLIAWTQKKNSNSVDKENSIN